MMLVGDDTPLRSDYKKLLVKYLTLASRQQVLGKDETPSHYHKVSDHTNQLELTKTLVERLCKSASLERQLQRILNVTSKEEDYPRLIQRYFVDRFVSLYTDLYGFGFDESEFDKLFQDLEKYILGKALFRYYAPISNLESEEDRITIGDYLIRKTSKMESAEFLQLDIGGLLPGNVPLPTDNFFIIEVTRPDYSLNKIGGEFQEVVEILNLFAADIVLVFYVKCMTPIFYPVESSSTKEIINARSGAPMLGTLSKNDCKNFISFYNKLANNMPARLKFAIKRYSYGRAARLQEDKIVDFVVALESLFSNSQNEISDKLALRVAVLHENKPSDYSKVREMVTSFYKMRSIIIHGRSDQLSKEIKKLEKVEERWLSKLESITRYSILAFGNLLEAGKGIENVIQVIDDAILDCTKRDDMWKKSGLFSTS